MHALCNVKKCSVLLVHQSVLGTSDQSTRFSRLVIANHQHRIIHHLIKILTHTACIIFQGKPTSEVRQDCNACVNTLQGVLANKKVEMTPPFCRSVAHCLRQVCNSLPTPPFQLVLDTSMPQLLVMIRGDLVVERRSRPLEIPTIHCAPAIGTVS